MCKAFLTHITIDLTPAAKKKKSRLKRNHGKLDEIENSGKAGIYFIFVVLPS